MSEKTARSVSIKVENDEWLSEKNNASALVDELIDQARKSGNIDVAALELQIKQKRRAMNEAKERHERLREELDELQALREEAVREEHARLDEALSVLENVPLDPENAAVQNWAGELGMTPQQLIDRAKQEL